MEREAIPAADPHVAFRARIDRAIDELWDALRVGREAGVGLTGEQKRRLYSAADL